MVSRALPLLYASQMAGLSGADAPADADDVIRSAVESVLARQSEDGAIGLWRIGDGQASPWLGAYATDFLMRASEAGYSVPRAALTRALDALVPVGRGDLWQAYGYDSDVPDQALEPGYGRPSQSPQLGLCVLRPCPCGPG